MPKTTPDPTPEERLGAKLKELRAAKDWTLRKAAAAVGISHMRLGELELGHTRGTGKPTRPTRDVVGRLARAYGVPVDYLLELAGFAKERPQHADQDNLVLDIFHDLDDDYRALAIRILQAIRDSTQ